MVLILSNGECDKSAEDVYDWIKYYQGSVEKINSIDFLNYSDS